MAYYLIPAGDTACNPNQVRGSVDSGITFFASLSKIHGTAAEIIAAEGPMGIEEAYGLEEGLGQTWFDELTAAVKEERPAMDSFLARNS